MVSIFDKADFCYFEKTNSIVTAIAVIKSRLIIFPIPKYLRIRNTKRAVLTTRPLLELVNIIEKVKNKARKATKKNKGTTPITKGSRE